MARAPARARLCGGLKAKLASGPAWAKARTAQHELAARGWTGQVINIEHTRLPELEPLFMAQEVSEVRTGTWDLAPMEPRCPQTT
jgi:hypothetical protein